MCLKALGSISPPLVDGNARACLPKEAFLSFPSSRTRVNNFCSVHSLIISILNVHIYLFRQFFHFRVFWLVFLLVIGLVFLFVNLVVYYWILNIVIFCCWVDGFCCLFEFCLGSQRSSLLRSLIPSRLCI